ncbi:MAG: VIT domain-containing protein [Planctomycetota bacterium]|nr:VIT domain-containing protein [Planctomycetota bacterium]
MADFTVPLRYADAAQVAEQLNALLAEAGAGATIRAPEEGLTGRDVSEMSAGGANRRASRQAGTLSFPWMRGGRQRDTEPLANLSEFFDDDGQLKPEFGVGDAQPRILQSSVSPEDEVWVIAKAPEAGAAPPGGGPDLLPGCGGIVCRPPGEEDADKQVPLPLKHTDVEAAIAGYIASVTVRQEFHNPFDEKIEAVYVFPLPQNAAVSEFIMTIGDRRIRGIIREREEAERIYLEARRQGYVASRLTQERANIFTQRIANLEPGKGIDVDITYYNTLTYADGWYEFVFPMVVGPRFNPPGSSEGVGAVPRGAHGASGQATEIQYLRPDERSGHDISLTLSIEAGVPIEETDCTSHLVDRAMPEPSQCVVELSPRDSIPNRDFVFRYRVAGDEPKASLLTHRDDRGGFFTLMVYPPREIREAQRAQIEMVFLVDCSGSMKGEPIAKAKRAVERALRRLDERDTFQIIRFSDRASKLGEQPIPATDANISRGLRYVRSLEAGGGTMMIRGIRAALDFPHDAERVRYVTFLTDGYIGNEREILGAIHDRLGESRIFSFGIGSSVNRYLLTRAARLGRGVVAWVGLNDDPNEVMDLFMQRIQHPAMTDVVIDWGAMSVRETYPQRLPDLFAGRPVILTGRFEGDGAARLRIGGRIEAERIQIPLAVNLDDASSTQDALANVWARRRIAALAERMTWDDDEAIPARIRDVALEYGLMSAFTAFIAVDSSRMTEGDHGTVVPVAVPVPDGVRYETTVADPAPGSAR